MGAKSTVNPIPYSKYKENGTIKTKMIGKNDLYHRDFDGYGYCIYNGTIKDIVECDDEYRIKNRDNSWNNFFKLDKRNVNCINILEELKTKKYVSFYYIKSTIISLNLVRNVITKKMLIEGFTKFDEKYSSIYVPKKFTMDMTDDDIFQKKNRIVINNDIKSGIYSGIIYTVNMIEIDDHLYEITQFNAINGE